MSVGVIRMVTHRLGVQRARGIGVAGGENQRTEIVEDGEVGRRLAKKLQIVALGFFEQALLAQQPGALEARLVSLGILG
jgi:hypothetical protein